MSTYARETAENLAESLESVFGQATAPDQVVLVVDGPLPDTQEAVITRFLADRRVEQFALVRLPDNVGLAAALNAGLSACLGEWTMRMDSDDICHPDRLRHQIGYAVAHPEVDVVSSWCEEFGGEKIKVKISPVAHEHIMQALRWRNVLVHPTILIKKSILQSVGGYSRRFPALEDYDLFIRLALAGFRFHVLPARLVRVRTSPEQMARRGGLGYCLNELQFRFEYLRRGFLRPHEFAVTAALYTVFRLVSGPLRNRMYALARS
jgi:glycosyltransferase involved in cell wall biosynthesis